MVYFAAWSEFFEASTNLFLEHPQHTRYTMKYRPGDAKIVLCVTNDIVCYKFKTDQDADLKAIDKLNQTFVRLMSSQTPSIDMLQVDEVVAKPAAAPRTKGRRG